MNRRRLHHNQQDRIPYNPNPAAAKPAPARKAIPCADTDDGDVGGAAKTAVGAGNAETGRSDIG
jgi:hypothetical protein